jgi:hypothetical protein
LVAWPVVTTPKDKGGLGVLNLRLQNDALLLKHLTSFITGETYPGSNSYGGNIIKERFPMQLGKSDLSGGKISSG